jgi:N-terminal domain of toast_rack, DUF2154
MRATSFAMIAWALSMSGCVVNTVRTGPLQHETRSIERDGSERAHVDLRMKAGVLRVSGGAADLMTADFTYNVPAWKPDIVYRSTAGRANLTVEQNTTGQTSLGNAKYEWDLRLNDEIPMDIAVQFGAGEAHLDLGSLSLRGIDVEMGVGELKMDLRGSPKHDYDVRVRGGVGEATVYLPRNVGIDAMASGGIGGIQVHGLRQQGGHWINDAYESAKVQIHVDISGGVGAINLFAE